MSGTGSMSDITIQEYGDMANEFVDTMLKKRKGGLLWAYGTLPEGHVNRKALQAVARAIRSIETVTGTIVEYDISKDDAELLCSAMSDLWLILESNGYNMDNNGMGSVSNYCTVSGWILSKQRIVPEVT